MPKAKAVSQAENIRWTEVKTKLGNLFLAATERGIVKVSLPGEGKKSFFRSLLELVPGAKVEEDSNSLTKTAAQLQEYANGERKQFELPLDLRVSPFQGRVLAALRRIPFGQTRSYGEVASTVGRPKAARAVGLACSRNPIPLVIPCHRVVGHDHSLVGFGGGLPMKKQLLALESSTS